MLRRASVGALAFLWLAGCSGSLQGPPAFQQAYGTVDQPCAASSSAAAHCTAHVYLVNHGGAGVGLATVVVPLTGPGAAASVARTAANAKCGGYIPSTPGGAEADLACKFDLPAGRSVAGAPILQEVNYSAAAASSSSGDGAVGVVSLGLAAVAGFIAFVALMLAIAGRGRASVSPAGGRRRPANRDEDEDW